MRGALALALISVAGCRDDVDGYYLQHCFLPMPDAPTTCDAADQKRFVSSVLRAHHLFRDQLRRVDLEDYETPEEILAAMTTGISPPDRFSFLASLSSEEQFFEEGKILGLGLSLRFVGDELRLSQVFGSDEGEPESPASKAGLERGDVVEAIGDEAVEHLIREGRLGEALGPNEPGASVNLSLRRGEGEVFDVVVARDFFEIDPVPVHEIIETARGPVGYVVLRSFIEPAVPALERAMADFRAAGVREVILDLRYNGGGLVSVARRLGSLLAGNVAPNEILFQRRYNDQNRNCLEVDVLEPTRVGLERLDRLVALTLEGTASASEQLIDGLAPHVDVTTVGERTFGKPVGQLGFPFCEDRLLRPMTFQTLNALGHGGYFDGLEPTCVVPETVNAAFGDEDEVLLRAGLTYLESGVCRGSTSLKSRTSEPVVLAMSIARRRSSAETSSSEPRSTRSMESSSGSTDLSNDRSIAR
ncbi:MAG: hypothetical protein HC923_04190 [Myxococcales bacterium]|nr:hypothetical protein [Myxococcales bacterium]